MDHFDVLVVGAGPAGMAAAVEARRHGLEVLVVDNQPAPGGQIWRSVDEAPHLDAILGPSYVQGREAAAEFRASGAVYRPSTQLWRIDTGFQAFVSQNRQAHVVRAKAVILATGAQERPVPFPGWTLPGVLTVGAAQILLKTSGQVPEAPAWIAGSGPLPLLYAAQLLRAGGRIAGYLDTTPVGQWKAALPHLPRALAAAGELVKGLAWMAALRRSGALVVRGVTNLEALGRDRIEGLSYWTSSSGLTTVEAGLLLVHEGVVPDLHAVLSLDCSVVWDPRQDCFVPVVDSWGESSQTNLFVAGDGAGIAGARAARLRGELAALRIAQKLGRSSGTAVAASAARRRRRLKHELAVRPFLDALFRPRQQVFAPPDQTIVCRCEEITAGEIRGLAAIGQPGPNQIKAATRTGMGPCQGRQCGYTVTRILAEAQNRSPADIGFYHVRPPLAQVTLGELASIDPTAAL